MHPYDRFSPSALLVLAGSTMSNLYSGLKTSYGNEANDSIPIIEAVV